MALKEPATFLLLRLQHTATIKHHTVKENIPFSYVCGLASFHTPAATQFCCCSVSAAPCSSLENLREMSPQIICCRSVPADKLRVGRVSPCGSRDSHSLRIQSFQHRLHDLSHSIMYVRVVSKEAEAQFLENKPELVEVGGTEGRKGV